VLRIGTLILVGPPLGFLPWHRNDRFPRCTGKPASGSRRLHAGCRSACKQVLSELIPGQWNPPVLTSPICFRHVTSGSLSFVSLMHTWQGLALPFPQRSPQWLFTTAAYGGLKPAPASRLRGAFPHLSCTFTWHTPSSPGGFHPQALTDPYVTVSRHTARTISPLI
jgi:hypothetical protein